MGLLPSNRYLEPKRCSIASERQQSYIVGSGVALWASGKRNPPFMLILLSTMYPEKIIWPDNNNSAAVAFKAPHSTATWGSTRNRYMATILWAVTRKKIPLNSVEFHFWIIIGICQFCCGGKCGRLQFCTEVVSNYQSRTDGKPHLRFYLWVCHSPILSSLDNSGTQVFLLEMEAEGLRTTALYECSNPEEYIKISRT